MLTQLTDDFIQMFGGGDEEIRSFFAPGRVNLIGEHTDYNGGYVFPCALSVGTYAIARKRADRNIRMYSKNFAGNGLISRDLEAVVYDQADGWANYPKGVLYLLKQAGFSIDTGFDVLFYGNIPNGAGLSSSASIELATAVLLKSLYELDLPMLEVVKYCQRAENEFVGVNCGILDQFAIGFGKKETAILLNCSTLEYEYCPMQLGDYTLVIANTNKRRDLASSKYNERRSECERALKNLQQQLTITSLSDITIADFETCKKYIDDETDQMRAKHIVSENDRTKRAADCLKRGDLISFGSLMNESHISLRDDFEVTGFELDALVSAAWQEKGVIGSRMTGAGFGGCTISLVKKEGTQSFIDNVGEVYKKKTGLVADFYVVNIGAGARELISGRD